ncbi:MAG: zinc-dependent peptidase [Bacteroidales bacterium]
MNELFTVVVIICMALGAMLLLYWLLFRGNSPYRLGGWKKPTFVLLPEERFFLEDRILFYNNLTDTDKEVFEYKVCEFLTNCRITGIQTEVSKRDKLLVACSAVIPIFRFTNWTYNNLDEVLIYPNSFDMQFQTSGDGRNVLGMVGTGPLRGKMILSQQALRAGFEIDNDKKNTGMHEFVHLIDMADGETDGVPSALLEQAYVLPWLNIIKKCSSEIRADKSDINPYAAVNNQEFFAVASEYFFERPELMEHKHPQLYALLVKMYCTKPKLHRIHKRRDTKRNDPCPCGSGKKFKYCCLPKHNS